MRQGTSIALGLSFGVVLGLLLDNLAIGLGIGIALGGASEAFAARRQIPRMSVRRHRRMAMTTGRDDERISLLRTLPYLMRHVERQLNIPAPLDTAKPVCVLRGCDTAIASLRGGYRSAARRCLASSE